MRVLLGGEQCGNAGQRPQARRAARLAEQHDLFLLPRMGIGEIDRKRARVEQRIGPRLGVRRIGVEAQAVEKRGQGQFFGMPCRWPHRVRKLTLTPFFRVGV
jgi:hypothetical protein